MVDYKTVTVDFLVVGSGGAGLRAAIAAHDGGVDVLVLGRSLRGKAHTVMAEGGINAALGNLDPEDNWVVHAADTLQEGEFLSHPKMGELLAKEAPDRIMELERWGAVFDRTPDGKISQRPFGAHTYRRTCHVGDRTGHEVLQTLLEQIRQKSIRFQEEVIITSLLTDSGRVVGATAVDMHSGEYFVYQAKAVMFATGGYARVYKNTSNPGESFGQGPAMAYHIGADLMDMEMVQFHPTGMVWPETAKGVLVTEAVRGEGGLLKNINGERFMPKYDPKRLELSARDIVARANYTEIKEGRGTENGGVYLDISHKPADFIKKKLHKMVTQMLDFQNVDITKEPVEVAPTAHYSMGGIRVDPETTAATVPGLYAAGEVASGVHGANRLGGNSLIDLLVFGNLGGIAAAEYVKGVKHGKIDKKQVEAEHKRLTAPFKREKGIMPAVIQDELREIMWQYVSIEKNGEELKKALQVLEEAVKTKLPKMALAGDLRFNPGWLDYLDVHSMVIICEGIIRSALYREESRGAHKRLDYPEMKDEWHVNIIAKEKKGKMTLSKVKVPEVGGEIKRWLESQKGK